jgi:hypothetical protein
VKRLAWGAVLFFCISALAPVQEDHTPEPYTEDEFPLWQHDLRRFEVVLIGSFPFTMLYSSLGYGLIRWGINGFSEGYAPTLSPSAETVPLTQQEKLGVVLAGVGISALTAIIDLIIVNVKREAGTAEEALSGTGEDE